MEYKKIYPHRLSAAIGGVYFQKKEIGLTGLLRSCEICGSRKTNLMYIKASNRGSILFPLGNVRKKEEKLYAHQKCVEDKLASPDSADSLTGVGTILYIEKLYADRKPKE